MAEAYYPRQPRAALAALTALLLAGCQAVVPRTAPPAPPPPPPAAPVETGPVAGLPTDQSRHRVALLVPMTGPNAAVGQSIANAANLALLDTGGKGVRVTTYDTGPGPAAAAARAIAEGNRLFLGPLLAEEVRAVSAAARPAGVPVIAFSNDSSVAGNGTFLMGFTPTQSVDRVVRYARAKGATRFAGLVPAGLYGRNASNALLRAAEQAGGSVVTMQTFDRSPKSLSTAAAKLAQGDRYDAVLIADGARIAIQAAPLLKRGSGAGTQLLGTELWATEAGLGTNPALNGALYASVSDTLYRQLSTKYRARFGKAPYRLASMGYDAVLLTVRIAADWKVGDRFPMRALTDAGGFAGIDGAFRFGSDGIAERALAVHQVGPGGATTVSAPPRSFGQ